MKPTLTVPNHKEGVREVHWGTAVKLFVWGTSVLGVVLSGLAVAGITRLFEMSANQEVMRAWITEEHAIDERFRAADAALQLEIDAMKRDDERYLTLEQYYHDMGPEIRRPRRGPR